MSSSIYTPSQSQREDDHTTTVNIPAGSNHTTSSHWNQECNQKGVPLDPGEEATRLTQLHNPPPTKRRHGHRSNRPSEETDEEDPPRMSGLGALSTILQLYTRAGPDSDSKIVLGNTSRRRRHRRESQTKQNKESGHGSALQSDTDGDRTQVTDDDRASIASRLRSRARRRKRRSVTIHVASQ